MSRFKFKLSDLSIDLHKCLFQFMNTQGCMRQRCRLSLVQACASTFPRLARDHGLGSIDYIVSSLPLAIMNEVVVERILRDADRLLAPDGMFLQYQYSLSQRRALERRFRDVRVGFTLANIPPAFVYECTPQPARAAAR